jgi:hypothetical protein
VLIVAGDEYLDFQRNLGDQYRETIWNIRDSYNSQFNILKDIALTKSRSDALDRIDFFAKRRPEMVERLRDIESDLSSVTLLFSGKSDLRALIRDFIVILEKSETIIQKQTYFVDRFVEIRNTADGIENDLADAELVMRKGRVDFSVQKDEVIVEGDSQNEPVLGEDDSDLINEDKIITGEEKPELEEPTGPTPEEIAAQEALEAAQAAAIATARLQQIADLEAARDSLSLTQQDAQARLQERRNRLNVLLLNELEKLTEASGLVIGRIQELRTEQRTSPLSATDQQLFLDLVAYESALQVEHERIARDITRAQNAISQYKATLTQVESQLTTNAASLEGPDYSIAMDYTVPNFTPEGLTDWTNYEYELPNFDPTELLTSDLSNVVGHAVSVPVVGGNNRVTADLVAEDNTILDLGISGAITELEDESSDLLDVFTYLYFGSGVDENGDNSQWIYGEASTPEQFALRTGTATFNGGLQGYYAHGSVSAHTLYQDGVSGELALEVDLGTSRITGEGRIEIDTAARSETLAFSLNESTVSESDSGLTRSLGFSANATLEGETTSSGNLGGTFYGDDMSEAGGSFGFDLGAGFSAGVWAAGVYYTGTEYSDYPMIVSYSDRDGGIYDNWNGSIGKEPELGDNLIITIGEVATTVVSVSKVHAEDYSYSSMGQWTASEPTSLLDTGYWVTGEALLTSGLDLRTGLATFAGNIIGDFVPRNIVRGDVVREDARGTIRLTADFSQDIIEGEMQFVSANNASEIITIGSFINNTGFFFQVSDADFDGPFSQYGFSGTFFGPSATEAGGSVWAVADAGAYNGVFRAGEGLGFEGFVTPTTIDQTDQTDQTDPSYPTDYSNYRGLAAYVAYDGLDLNNASFPVSIPVSTGFVALDTILRYFSPFIALFENTSIITDPVASTDTLGQSYSYTNWGSWDSESGIVDGVAFQDVAANWIVYDPTTDLRTTGQATYNGDAVGLTSNGGNLTGDIQLTADFANDTVTGNMSLNTPNGQTWADASFDTSITRDTNASGFQGALTGSDVNSGIIFGGFAGPNAEEVGGGWQIDNANGTDGVGIFRAQN